MDVMKMFELTGKVVIITGGAGLLGRKHAEAVLEAGGIPVLLDICDNALYKVQQELTKKYNLAELDIFKVNITEKSSLEIVKKNLIDKYGRIDALINNAANNPKVESKSNNMIKGNFENFPIERWLDDIAVGLTGSFLCAQTFGKVMEEQKNGVILNISSDLGIIAPDQRIYRKETIPEENQNIKPVTYSVIKHGIIGITKYLATYWCKAGIRVNALCPAGVFNGQDEEFVDRLVNLIPMGRMANVEEYKGTVVYMLSDASSYMTGSTVIVDGGRTCW